MALLYQKDHEKSPLRKQTIRNHRLKNRPGSNTVPQQQTSLYAIYGQENVGRLCR